MDKIIKAVPLYTFVKFCNESSLKKEVLDLGAGGDFPPLYLFYNQGYKTKGIDISKLQVDKAKRFSKKNNMELNIIKGDMRELPFKDESISFIYSYNSIFHLTKEDTLKAINEIKRVLKKDGLCFVNFISVDDGGYGKGKELNKGEFIQYELGNKVVHSYYKDKEPEKYFYDLKIVYKQKRIINREHKGEIYNLAYLDYIVKKV
ncbi:MAG: class I SAM-dependent methyltransferase [Firmicutes bacterium]|nr:class I SAM-dependent methyltransferase [Bacillota bacterium]